MSVSVSIGGSKTRVTQVSRYKIEEETPERLVLRAKKIFYFIGGALFLLFGGILLAVSIGAALDSGPRLGLGAFGALFFVGGVALIRSGIRNKDRIVFERSAKAIRFEMTNEKDRHEIPFADVAKLELRQKEERTADEVKLLNQIFVVKKNGDEQMLDEASDAAQMALVGLKAAALCGAPFVDRALQNQ
jgi:hypothetical protein